MKIRPSCPDGYRRRTEGEAVASGISAAMALFNVDVIARAWSWSDFRSSQGFKATKKKPW